MNLTIRGIFKATSILLLGYSATMLVDFSTSSLVATALPQQMNSSLTLAQANYSKDNLVIPGERVGPVTRNTTRQQLSKLFGESRLTDKSEFNHYENQKITYTEVKLSGNRSFTVVWSDNTRTKPVQIHNLGSAWKTPEGIGMGTSLSELRRKLGEFQLYGLGWQYSGLMVLEKTPLSRYQDKLRLEIATAKNADRKFRNDYEAVMGERLYSSSNPHWQKLGMRVGAMTVILNPIQ